MVFNGFTLLVLIAGVLIGFGLSRLVDKIPDETDRLKRMGAALDGAKDVEPLYDWASDGSPRT